MQTPLSELQSLEGREVECKVGDLWQLGESFFKVVSIGRSVKLRIIKPTRDSLRIRKDVTVSEAEWREVAR